MNLNRPSPLPSQKNIRIILSYDGAPFAGYQWQPQVYTVQQCIWDAWKTLTGEENVSLFGCSRLDAGVNANQFVLNLYSETNYSEDKILRGLNGIFLHTLKQPIFIYDVAFVDAQFHARYDAKGKHYRYKVWYGFESHRATRDCWVHKFPTAPVGIHKLAQKLLGTHDFAGFRAQDCGATNTTKTIYACDAWKDPTLPQQIIIDIWGDGFLKNMVRNMVGTLIEECSAKIDRGTLGKVLISKDRQNAGVCAPAHALTLEKVYYETIRPADIIGKKPGHAVEA